MPEGALYEVERLIAKRKCSNNRVEYLVRWKGYSKKSDTWEPLSNLSTCMDLVQAFNAVKKRTRPSSSRASHHPAKDNLTNRKVTARKPKSSEIFLNPSKTELVKKTSLSSPSTQNGGGISISRQQNGSTMKRHVPRMTAPLLPKRAKLTEKSLPHDSRSSSPVAKARDAHRPRANLNIPLSARAFKNFMTSENKNELRMNGYFHISPPSSDHEYFSTPYRGFISSWREKRGESPSTSGSEGNDSTETEVESCDVIIDIEPAEVPCVSSISKATHSAGLGAGVARESESRKYPNEETSLRKLTLRGGLSRNKYLHVLRRGDCMEVVLSDEAGRNPLTPEILDEFSRLLDKAATSSCTMVLISSIGDFFCSGFDLKYLMKQLSTESNASKAVKTCAASVRNFVNCLIDFPKPLVAMVQGPAIGLGCAILPHFDTVYSSDRAYYATPYTEMGQTPEACSSYLFPLIMGHSVANDMLLNGITLTAIEAKSVGLVSDVYLHDSLKQNVLPILKSLSEKSHDALAATKELIRNPQRARLKYINQCEYLALRQRWEDEDTLKYMIQYVNTYNRIS